MCVVRWVEVTRMLSHGEVSVSYAAGGVVHQFSGESIIFKQCMYFVGN